MNKDDRIPLTLRNLQWAFLFILCDIHLHNFFGAYDMRILVSLQDISRCLLWTQHHRQAWPVAHTNPLVKPNDLLILDKIKESFCAIRVSVLTP